MQTQKGDQRRKCNRQVAVGPLDQSMGGGRVPFRERYMELWRRKGEGGWHIRSQGECSRWNTGKSRGREIRGRKTKGAGDQHTWKGTEQRL